MPYKRRYLIRHYHPVFDYYVGFHLSTKAESQVKKTSAPGIFGRPELCSEVTIKALPVAWDAHEAKEFYETWKPFAYLTTDEKGKVQAGWIEEDIGTTYHPNFSKVLSLKDYLKAGEPAYMPKGGEK